MTQVYQFIGSVRENSRERYLSILGGYRTAPSGAFNIALLGGVTFVTLKRALLSTTADGRFPPQTYAFDTLKIAVTVGADIAAPMGRRFGLTVPIRLTKSVRQMPRSGFDVRAGVGLTVEAFRRVM